MGPMFTSVGSCGWKVEQAGGEEASLANGGVETGVGTRQV